MRIIKPIACLVILSGMMTLNSCQNFYDLFKNPDKETTETEATTKTTVTKEKAPSTKNNTKNNSKKVKKEKVLPQDRKAIGVPIDPKTYSPEEFAKGVIKGDWAITKVMGQPAVGEKAPYIKFAQEEGRIYGNNGCNTINGEYSYDPKDGKLRFDNIAVTMMLCHLEGITDYLINQALNEVRTYKLVDTEEGYEMNLYDGAGKEVMTLIHQNLDFLNGTWKITSLNGEEVDIKNMKLVFDIDEHKFHGNTGCNVINGNLTTDMDEPNTFSFESIGVTMMMCPTMEYQTMMLVALEEACKAKPINKNQVQLLNEEGKVVISLQRTTDK